MFVQWERVGCDDTACLHELNDENVRLKVGKAHPSYMMSMARGLNIADP